MYRLEQQLQSSLRERNKNSKLRQLVINHTDAIDFCSNVFLGLSRSADMRNAFLSELNSMSYILGSTGSRLLMGNSTYVENLEQGIATFHRSPSALIFNSGFDANWSLFSTLPQKGDIILYDEFIHASVHEGMRNSRASHRVPFAHSDILDLASHIDVLSYFHERFPIFIYYLNCCVYLRAAYILLNHPEWWVLEHGLHWKTTNLLL